MPEAAKIDGEPGVRRTNLRAARGRLALYHVLLLGGVFLFWYMIRSGLADLSIGSAGKEGA